VRELQRGEPFGKKPSSREGKRGSHAKRGAQAGELGVREGDPPNPKKRRRGKAVPKLLEKKLGGSP